MGSGMALHAEESWHACRWSERWAKKSPIHVDRAYFKTAEKFSLSQQDCLSVCLSVCLSIRQSASLLIDISLVNVTHAFICLDFIPGAHEF